MNIERAWQRKYDKLLLQLRDSEAKALKWRKLAFMLRYSEGKDREAAKKAYDECLDEILGNAFK